MTLIFDEKLLIEFLLKLIAFKINFFLLKLETLENTLDFI